MQDINLEQYKVFYFVAKNSSFSLAGKELFISQSAVSQSIKNLENRLKISLFIRKSKNIQLTKEGEILFKSVENAIVGIVNSEKMLICDSNNPKKELSIAASDTISKYFLLPYIEKFNAIYPEVKLKISNKASAYCLEMLENNETDLAVVTHTDILSKSRYNVKKLKKCQDVFVASSKFSHLKGKKLSIFDIKDIPILTLGAPASTRTRFDNFTKSHGLSIIPEIETQSIGLLKDLARIGLGISYVTDLSLSRTSDLFVLDIIEPLSANFISVATLNNAKNTKYTDFFIELIS